MSKHRAKVHRISKRNIRRCTPRKMAHPQRRLQGCILRTSFCSVSAKRESALQKLLFTLVSPHSAQFDQNMWKIMRFTRSGFPFQKMSRKRFAKQKKGVDG